VSKKYSPLDSWIDPEGVQHSQKVYDTFEQRTISVEQAVDFLKYVESKGLEMVASVYDCVAAKVAAKYCKVLKISSANITNFPLAECVIQLCDQLVIDTGNSTDSDIENILDFIYKKKSNIDILIQYSPTRPPMESSTWNMWKIKDMQSRFQLPVGLSDHDNDTNQALLSLGLGVVNIEKGVMSNRAWSEGVSDSAYCIPIEKLNSYLDTVLLAKNGLEYNSDAIHDFDHAGKIRSGLYAKHNLKEGHIITKGDILSLVPELGVKSSELYNVIGLRVINHIKEGDPIERKDIGD